MLASLQKGEMKSEEWAEYFDEICFIPREQRDEQWKSLWHTVDELFKRGYYSS